MEPAEWIAVVQASVAAVLTIITAAYVVYSRTLAKTAARQLEAQSRPYVWVDLAIEPSGMIWLRIRNTGASAAESLKLDLAREITTVTDAKLNDLPMFALPLDLLPPGLERRYMLGSHVHLLKDFEDLVIGAGYRFGTKEYSDSFVMSVRDFMGTVVPQKGETAKEIEALRKEVEKLGKDVRKIAERPEPLPPLGPW